MRSLELVLPAVPTAPAEARAVVEAIGSDLPEPVLVDAKLLLTELVANAIRHASRGIQGVIIRIRRNHYLRVEVLDPGPMFNPDPRPPGTGAGGVGGCISWTRLPPPGASSPTRPVRRSGSSCGWRRVEGAISVSRPDVFAVETGPTGALVLSGELDLATIQALQDKIDEIVVPGQPIVLDLADLTFLDSSAMHCFVRTFEATGHPVVLLNESRALRRILGHMTQQPEAWVFDGENPS